MMGYLARSAAIVAAISILSTAGSFGLVQTANAQTGTQTTRRFQQDDYRRRYLVYTPANIDSFAGKRPLVLVIHGGGGTDRQMLRMTKKRWNQLADQHGFYVAYPNAVDKLWDFGEGDTSSELQNRVDDLAYFRRVINGISARHNIDQRRIFATGISRGGQASYYLACNLPQRIRAIMPVAMSTPKFMVNECEQGPPVGLAVVNGTADPLVPYEGGWITLGDDKRDIVLSTDETMKLWRVRNRCADRPAKTTHIDKPGDKTSVDVTEWAGCAGAPVKLYRVNNGGHTWPSGRPYLGERRIGKTSKDISAADEGWAFFSQF